MIRSSIEKMASEIGFDIAHSCNETQANLLNGLSRGLCNQLQRMEFEMQLSYIVNKLDANSIKLIKELNEFIKLREGEL